MCSIYADENQAALHTKFPRSHYLSNQNNVDHVFLWSTFFRKNLHRFVIDYLGISLYLYQQLIIYMMGICPFIVIVACRAAAKSFIIAIYACCRCILYPGSKIVIASATRGQSKLIVSEKIQNELMAKSPALRREIKAIKTTQSEVVVHFRNGSTITVVTANDNARGNRSHAIVREEFRQIDKHIDDSVLSPFQIIRKQPYMFKPEYANLQELQERPVDIYITSSWLDNGHWMWEIVDKAFGGMLKDEVSSCLLAFDESITLKHTIKPLDYLINEKKKQDPLTWRMEFLNERVKENSFAFFTFKMIDQNRVCKHVFYPRRTIDVRTKRQNPYKIRRQAGEIRIISCDMAFVTNKKNDNSIFTCMRLLPETTTYNTETGYTTEVKQGYRRIAVYMESVQGGETQKQAIRIRQIFEDFDADYIVLDTRNAGIAIYDYLAKIMYDEERGCEYSPLCCMNDDAIANRIKIPEASKCIYAINASQRLNSDIAIAMRQTLMEQKIEFLIPFQQAQEEVLINNSDYMGSPDAETQLFYESPFLETQQMMSEMTDLVYEKKEQTGAIVISERGNNRKDRYTSVSYGNYFANLLEQDLLSHSDDYEFGIFIN